MKRYFSISLVCMSILSLAAGMVMAKPSDQRQKMAPSQAFVDIVGDVDGTAPVVGKAAADTIWIATWDFEGCDDTGWTRSDNRILNDGIHHWSVNTDFSALTAITGDAAVVGEHNLCWPFDGYDNDWNQGICIHYVGDSFLSFDWVIDSEGGFDFLQVETDSSCASFAQVDYDVDPEGNAQALRDLVWSVSGFDTVTAHVDSLFLTGYGTVDTNCVYIAFFADGAFSPSDGLQPTVLGVAAVVDNVDLEGGITLFEDFTAFTETAWFSFVNLQDSTPFGIWARVFSHITDNDICSENFSCAWLTTDDTTPTFNNDPSMAFGPGGFVIKNWWDELLVGPWVSLSTTASAVSTVVQFRRFPGNFFTTSRAVQNWSIRGRGKVDNTDSVALGDSIDCVSSWGHGSSWNSLSLFSWVTNSWDATSEFDPSSRDIQVRFRESDWQWIAGSSPPSPFRPGPGPYWDRVRLGRQVLNGPVIDEGIDARFQANDAAPNEPGTPENGPLYVQGVTEIFGTTPFSMSDDLGGNASSFNLIVGDSITCNIIDVLGVGLKDPIMYAAIVAGPHVNKAPAPHAVGPNGFFSITADSSKTSNGIPVADRYFVDMDDSYFRGGDVLRYVWFAEDVAGGITSNPAGLTAVPTSVAQAEAATGGLFEVNFLPCITWDPTYLTAIQAHATGDIDPDAGQLANSSQKNCILYYENINARRRSGEANRTSFMYTLDKLGYRGAYDVYDHTGLGNTNNHLGARMSPGQAAGYSLVVYDAGNRNPGAPILPDGFDLDGEKIDMSSWFSTWNTLSGSGNPEHTLWIMGSNVMEEKTADPLLTLDMAAVFNGADQGQDSNPDVFGVADFTNHIANASNHTGEQFALNGGCPIIRDYDDLGVSGVAVRTHAYGKGSANLATGAIVMNANAAGYSTILQSFPWFDIRASVGASPAAKPDEVLMLTVLGAALAAGCEEAIDPTDAPDDKDQIAAPSRTALHQNTPNPFNPTTMINFDLARDSHVSLKIYDVAGRLVRGLANEKMVAGFGKQVKWDGFDNSGNRVSSGVYFYRLVAGDVTATKKMVVMK